MAISSASVVGTASSMDTVRLMSFSELLDFIDFASIEIHQPLRLRNVLLAYRNAFPFATVGEYLDSADADAILLARLSNCGRKTLADLRRLVDEVVGVEMAGNTIIQQDGGASSPAPAQKPPLLPDAIRAITFLELIAKSHVSPRLKNSITHEIERGTFPFGNLGEYFDNGGISALMEIPDFGKKTAEELRKLIESVAGGDVVASQTVVVYPKKRELAEQLEDQYPGIFEPLIHDYRSTSEIDALLCQKLEKQIQQLLKNTQHAEICQRRFFDETLESIGQSFDCTRERIRQIEAKYKGLVTDIYTEDWLSRAVNKVLAQQEDQNQLPSNDELAKCHPKMFFALRKVYLPESHRNGALTNEERHVLAGKFGLDGLAELIASNKWSLEKLIHEVKAFARELGNVGTR